MRAASRPVALGAGLAATLALTLWAALQPEATTPAEADGVTTTARARPGARSAPAAPAVPAAPAALPTRTRWPDLPPVALAAWSAPPAPATSASAARRAPVAASAAAVAPVPVFPYAVIGRYDDGTGTVAWLATPQRTLAVRAGDTVDGQWRIELVAPTRIDLLWLPTQQRQSLATPRS